MVSPRRSGPQVVVPALDADGYRWLAEITGALVGHVHLDALAHATVNAVAATVGDVAVLDILLSDGRASRVTSGAPDPARAEAVRQQTALLVPPVMTPGSVLHAVLREGRMVVRGELGSGGDDASFSLAALPVRGEQAVVAALSVVAFGRHDRFGRLPLAALEQAADRLALAIDAVRHAEETEGRRLALAGAMDVQRDTTQTLERSVTDLREQVALLQAENALLRLQLEPPQPPTSLSVAPPMPGPLVPPLAVVATSGPRPRGGRLVRPRGPQPDPQAAV
jgi:hypothetical protein